MSDKYVAQTEINKERLINKHQTVKDEKQKHMFRVFSLCATNA